MNRRESMTNTRHNNTNDPQIKCSLGRVSKNILLESLGPTKSNKHQTLFKIIQMFSYTFQACANLAVVSMIAATTETVVKHSDKVISIKICL